MADRGMAAIAGEMVDQDAEADAEDEQLGLFALPASEAGLRKAEERHWSGIGRKPGSRNKRSSRTLEFLQRRYRDPRAILAEMAQANPFDLAAMLGCTPHEAYQEKRLAAIGLLPYWAARITPEVNDNRQIINLTIGAGAGGGVAMQVMELLAAEDVSAATDDGSKA